MDANAEKILFAIYAEQNAKKPQTNATVQNMGLEGEVLGRAVNSLYAARLISGVTVKFGDEDETPFAVATDNILITRRGATRVETALELKASASAIQKLRAIAAFAAAPGWEEVRKIAERALKEHMEAG
jgi:hypothetical protein